MTKQRFNRVVRMPFTTQHNCAAPLTRRRRRSLDSHHDGLSGLRASIGVIDTTAAVEVASVTGEILRSASALARSPRRGTMSRSS